MGKNPKEIVTYGLVGKTLEHSFSQAFFTQKFKDLQWENHSYLNYEFPDIKALAGFLLEEVYTLNGFNVTIPYKETILPFLDEVSEEAAKVGAVNTVWVKSGNLHGYNTDVYGFRASILPVLGNRKKALILGTGGASKAVVYALHSLGVHTQLVSRKPEQKNVLSYEMLTEAMIASCPLIVNCTPLGTYPETEAFPKIPYAGISDKHLVYDLVYNPEKTRFLSQAEARHAQIKNGKEMLYLQAEKAWEIWNQEEKNSMR